MADGSYQQISSIKPGDIVMSYDTANHKMYPNVVLAVPVFDVFGVYTLNNNVTTDGFESFYVMRNGTGTWVHTSNLTVGDEIYNPLTGSYLKVNSIKFTNFGSNNELVYDIIGASGITS